MNLEEQRAALIKAAQGIITKSEAEGRDLTEDEATELTAKSTELDELDAKIEAARKSAETMSKFKSISVPKGSKSTDKGDGPEGGKGGDEVEALSPGEYFVKSGGLKALQEASGTFSGISVPGEFKGNLSKAFKAATDTAVAGATSAYLGTGVNALQIPGYDTNIEMLPRMQLTVADLFGSGSTDFTSITYPVQGAKDGAPAPTAELARKPQVHYNWTSRTDNLRKIAGITKISDEARWDTAYVVSEINGQLLYDLKLAEEQQLLSGTGTDPQVQGLLNRSGVQVVAGVTGDSTFDVLFKAMTAIQTLALLSPDAVVIHPTDYQRLRLRKDANGQYYGGGPFTGQYGNGGILENPPLWGLRTVVTPAATLGQAIVGAFKTATVYRKGGVTLESTNSNEDDFEFNRITIRAEERLMLQVRKPNAFARVTLPAIDPIPA